MVRVQRRHPTKANRYELVGHTFAGDWKVRGAPGNAFETVDFARGHANATGGRIRVTHWTRVPGDHRAFWFYEMKPREAAVALLERIRREGIACLGKPHRVGPPAV